MSKPKKCATRILCSARLGKDWQYDKELNLYYCPFIHKEQLINMLTSVIKGINPESDSITITIEGIENNVRGRHTEEI